MNGAVNGEVNRFFDEAEHRQVSRGMVELEEEDEEDIFSDTEDLMESPQTILVI